NSLRWIGIGSARIPRIDFAASGGVHTPEAVIKTLLAGASAVEICSTVYRNKNKVIKEMADFLSKWMDKKGYDKIVQFKGKLNAKDMQGLDMYERTQFLKYYNFHE
ncbi:MAG: diguanylate cyclase, partial [Bacteroidaceae bacterium]